MKTEINPSIQEIIENTKFFYPDKIEGTISCYTNQRLKGYDGYLIKIKYLHEIGYFWDASGFWSSTDQVEKMLNNITKDRQAAFGALGLCPKCNSKLYDSFTSMVHDVSKCGKKKPAIAQSTEFS